MSRKTQIALLGILSILLWVETVSAGAWLIDPWGVRLDLPSGWSKVQSGDAGVFAFSDPSSAALLQVFCFTPDSFPSARALEKSITDSLQASGDSVSFTYNGADAALASITFRAAGNPVKAYATFLNDPAVDAVFIAFAGENRYAEFEDQILSVLDSVSIGTEALDWPGPISQFYRDPRVAHEEKAIVDILGEKREVSVDPLQAEAVQVVIEREARILAAHPSLNVDAWSRYYRIVYRDSYHRLDALARHVEAIAAAKGWTGRVLAEELLRWIQSWIYERHGSLSDLLSPVQAAMTGRGDCDARGLVYALLLRRLGVDTVLFVSSRYSHAICGVAVEGAGARISHEGTDYLVAELTETVDIGLIAADMADPAGWIAVDFDWK